MGNGTKAGISVNAVESERGDFPIPSIGHHLSTDFDMNMLLHTYLSRYLCV